MAQNNQQNPFSEAFKTLDSFGTQSPNLDMNEFMSASKKQFETFQEAGQLLADSFQTIAQLQSETLQNNVQTAMNMFQDMSGSKDPSANASKQADFAKTSFEKAQQDAQKIADIASEANQKASDLIQGLVNESMTQLKTTASAATSPKKPANRAA